MDTLVIFSNGDQPEPPPDDETIENGDTVEISGSGFGTGPKVLLYEPFAASLPGNPARGSWELDARPAPVYDKEVKHSGAGASRFDYGTSSNTWWGGYLHKIAAYDQTYYQSYWWRHNASSLASDGVCKINQWHGNSGQGDFAPGWMNGSSAGGWMTYASRENGTTTGDDGSHWWSANNQNMMNQPNKWRHIEMFGKQSSAAGVADGSIDFRVDGVSMKKLNSIVTRTTSSRWSETSFMHGGNVNAGTPKSMWVDEFYFQAGTQRVTLEQGSLVVPQAPNVWADGRVEFTAFLGGLAPGDVACRIYNAGGTVVKEQPCEIVVIKRHRHRRHHRF